MSKLFVYPKKGEVFSFSLKNRKISIGRFADNDIYIPDAYCSGYHTFIYPSESGYVVRDNNSKNGTFVNGKRIKSKTELTKGDEILIGSTRIIFNKELRTNVKVVEASYPGENVNTIIPLEEILEQPEFDTTMQADAAPLDLQRSRLEHRAFSILNEVSKALITHKPLKELLDYIMNLISQNLPMDRGILMLKEGNPPQLIPKVARINEKKLSEEKIHVSQSIVKTAMDKKSAVLTYDAQADPRFRTKDSVIESNIHSAICVPLWDNKEIIGLVYSDRIYMRERFSDEDLRLLTFLSNLAAVKIENAKLFEEVIEKEKIEKELALASQIQKDFLPKEKLEYENFEIVGSNMPCYQVGGDYYDFFKIDPDRLGIIIADVSGKGISASLLMASLRASLHSEIHAQYKIEKMVNKLNGFVHRSSAINRFITFFFCELNRENGELTYINAGHNPPLLIDCEGKICRFECCGMCLGMFPSTTYEAKKVTLKPKDMAVLFTDGITESRNKAREEFEEERLIKLLQKHSDLPAQKLLDKIFSEINSFISGAEQMDDMTLVIIKRIS